MSTSGIIPFFVYLPYIPISNICFFNFLITVSPELANKPVLKMLAYRLCANFLKIK